MTIVQEVVYEEQATKVGNAVALLERLCDDLRKQERVDVRGFSVRLGVGTGDEHLLTLRAMIDGEQVVAFHAATTLPELLRGTYARMRNGKLKWRADGYANR